MPDVYAAKKKSSKKPTSKREPGPKNVEEYSEVMREERPTSNPLATFSVRPRGVKFETQDQKEQVLLLLRRHGLTNVSWFLIWVLMLAAPMVLSFFPILTFLPLRFKLMSVVIWYLMSVGYFLERFLNWYFNVYIITDERVIDIDFYSLIYKEISSAKIENIEDVTYKMGGALRNVANFGTIYIQTAGERREFDFNDVPKPQVVTKFLNEMMLEEEQEKLEGRVR